MLKYILARLRWGSLSPEQKEKLKTLSIKEVFNSPYLIRKYYG
jgi:hypothetical protein